MIAFLSADALKTLQCKTNDHIKVCILRIVDIHGANIDALNGFTFRNQLMYIMLVIEANVQGGFDFYVF